MHLFVDEIPPIDGPNPADEKEGCNELQHANDHGGVALTLDASHQRAYARQQNVDD